MSDYQFEVGKEYRTRNGLPCVLLSDDSNVGRVWKVRVARSIWAAIIERITIDDYKPVPPERTVDQWHLARDGCEVVRASRSFVDGVIVRWTIGSDGKPAYAVRLDDAGEPMYRVERVAKGGDCD